MKFEDFLKAEALEIEGQIQNLLDDFGKKTEIKSVTLLPLIKAFKNANKGGKKIRGVLVKLGYELVGSRKREDILRVAAAYEIFHTAILAHDDIIDESPTRRGQPSLYKSVGIVQAITLGDCGFFLSVKIIAESNFPDKNKNEAIRKLLEVLVDTTIGQMLDIAHGDKETTAKLKTARYTIAGPLQVGAILAGADQRLIKKLGEFGEKLGIAFQIRDDILDGEVRSLESAEEKAFEYTSKAKKMIPVITKDQQMVKILEGMTEYLVERRK